MPDRSFDSGKPPAAGQGAETIEQYEIIAVDPIECGMGGLRFVKVSRLESSTPDIPEITQMTRSLPVIRP